MSHLYQDEEERDMALLRGHAAQLAEHFDTVQPKKRLGASDVTIGSVFGRLTVICVPFRRALASGEEKWAVRCRCKCGTEKDFFCQSLIRGSTRSCGCLRSEMVSAKNTERFSRTPYFDGRLYNIWKGIIHRCENPKHSGYAFYGGRGIRMCQEWRQDYRSFQVWALSHPLYGSVLTIERIDVNGDYSPGNCTWISLGDQAKNRTNTRRYEYQGKIGLLRDWIDDPRCKAPSLNSLYQRLDRGWTFEEALTTPSKKPTRNGGDHDV